MRVNVYGEELTDRVELVEKAVTEPCPTCAGTGSVPEEHEAWAVEQLGCQDCQGDGVGETRTFYGLRLWLKFPNQDWWVHRKYHGEVDDDSSAVTIWAPSKDALADVLRACLAEVAP